MRLSRKMKPDRKRTNTWTLISQMEYMCLIGFLLSSLFDGINGYCDPPTSAPDNATLMYQTFKSNYSEGDLALYECSSNNGGFGFVAIFCEASDQWSSPDRECKDALPVGGGTIVGFTLFGSTAILMVIFIFTALSQKKSSDDIPCDMEPVVVYGVNSSSSPGSSADVTLPVRESTC